MADQRRLPSPGDIAEGRGDGRYQVWHADDFTGMTLSKIEREPYVHGYTHVASVQATSLPQAAEMTRHGETPWTENPGVQALASEPRSTYFGDVIIDPEGCAYRIEDSGFSEVKAEERWSTAAEPGPEAKPLSSPGEIADSRDEPGLAGPDRGKGRGR